jgi:hypothetical protein
MWQQVQQRSKIVLWLIVLGILAGERAPSAAWAQNQKDSPAHKVKVLVILIGGMDSDPTAAQIQQKAKRPEGNSGMYRLMGDLKHDQINAQYFNWNGTDAGKIKAKPVPGTAPMIAAIQQEKQADPLCQVVIVGNSWGGHTAAQVCQEIGELKAPISVDSLVFLDPSSAGRTGKGKPEKLPPNVKHAVNYYTRNVFGWRSLSADERLENIDLGDRKFGFLVDRGPAYDATFDFQAHVAAEWDERIHADIRKRILARVEMPEGK